jgi:hypothetical protein
MERDTAGRHVLDEMDRPGGVLRLVAFEGSGSIQIGVTKEDGALLTSIGLHGRPPMEYEPYAWRDRGWAVAFGGVPLDAARAEVRNEDGEIFPARIVPLPAELDTEDRAAWGLIDRFEVECPLVSFDEAGRRLTTIGEYAVAPRTTIGEGDDPIGGHWKVWISRLDLGPMLNVSHEGGRSGCGIGKLPGGGFGTGGVGRSEFPGSGSWEVSGLVTAEAEHVEVTTTKGPKVALILSVPQREFGPCKAYVAFFPGEEEPRSLSAFDADGEVLATFDYGPWLDPDE